MAFKTSDKKVTLRDLERAILSSEGAIRDNLLQVYVRKTLLSLNDVQSLTNLIRNYRAFNHVIDFLEKFDLSPQMRKELRDLAYSLMVRVIEYFKATKACDESILMIKFVLRIANLSRDKEMIMKSLHNTGVMMISCGMEAMGKEYIEKAKEIRKEL